MNFRNKVTYERDLRPWNEVKCEVVRLRTSERAVRWGLGSRDSFLQGK